MYPTKKIFWYCKEGILLKNEFLAIVQKICAVVPLEKVKFLDGLFFLVVKNVKFMDKKFIFKIFWATLLQKFWNFGFWGGDSTLG